MRDLLKMWIFIAQFHLRDPDPNSEYGSGFSLAILIRIRIQPGDLNPDPPGSGSATLVGTYLFKVFR